MDFQRGRYKAVWGDWETKDLTVCDDKKQRGGCSWEAHISTSSLRRCLSLSACLGILSMQISVPRSVPGTEFILVLFSQRLTKYDPQNISAVIDSARWRSLGNKCVVREIYLAAFDVIMWERRHWRNAASKSEGCGSCQWFCHSYRVIAVIPSRAVLLKNRFTLGPIHCCGYEWEEKIDLVFCHTTQWNNFYCQSPPPFCMYMRCQSSPLIHRYVWNFL